MEFLTVASALLSYALTSIFAVLYWCTHTGLGFAVPAALALAAWAQWQSRALSPSLLYRWF